MYREYCKFDTMRCMSLIVTPLLCVSLSLQHSSSPGLSLSTSLGSTLPGPSTSEVTTLWRYTDTFVIIMPAAVAAALFRSLTDSEASPDRPATSLASSAISARQKGHVKSASTSHTLPLDLPSSSSAAATTTGTTAIEDLIRYSNNDTNSNMHLLTRHVSVN